MHLTASLIHALPIHERRVLNASEAASYVGVSPAHFKKLVNDGVMPAPLKNFGQVRRWDKEALDAGLDRLGGLDGRTGQAQSAYDAWKGDRG